MHVGRASFVICEYNHQKLMARHAPSAMSRISRNFSGRWSRSVNRISPPIPRLSSSQPWEVCTCSHLP